MKYKVTITSGHEDEKVYDNVLEEKLEWCLNTFKGKKILIEPMPEKQKVTVWFYVAQDGKDIWSKSKVNFEAIKSDREIEIINGRKVSEIKSMEVEL
jgi:hypothetical protein